MRTLGRIAIAAAVILSWIMCFAVGYEYASLVWCGRYGGCSAPPYSAFFLAIPFLSAIFLLLLLSCICRRKERKNRET